MKDRWQNGQISIVHTLGPPPVPLASLVRDPNRVIFNVAGTTGCFETSKLLGYHSFTPTDGRAVARAGGNGATTRAPSALVALPPLS